MAAIPALVGQSIHHYVVPFEFDAAGVSAITSSNPLQVTMGAF
jgi:hypothetical protein